MTGTSYAPGGPADATLVAAARRGDLAAWETLVRRYQEAVFRVAWLVVRDSTLAEKATRSSFVRAFHALPTYEMSVGVAPWLFRIAAGESRHLRRDASRPRSSDRLPDVERSPQLPATVVPTQAEAESLSAVERGRIGEAFERLGEQDRLILAARYLFGLSRADTAGALSLSVAMLDEHLATALSHLRARMATAR